MGDLASLVSTLVIDAPEGQFGPSALHLPPQFKDIPYAPFSKNDKLGRVVDWNSPDSMSNEVRLQAGVSGRRGAGGKFGREPKEAYGAGAAGAFAYFHDEDEASFSLVDSAKAASKRGGSGSLSFGRFQQNRGRGGPRGGMFGGRGGTANRGGQFGRGGANQRGRGGGRFGWKDWNNKEQRQREASIIIGSEWQVLEEIEFSRLAKLRLDVDTTEPETICSSQHGFLSEYDRIYDRVNTKNEKPLQIIERVRYNPTTSDDPVIQELSGKDSAQIYATDSILSMLMCTTRTAYPWDIILTREGDKLYMDKRENGPFDYPSVNENASDPPMENEKDTLNSPSALSLEATFINSNFTFQVVRDDTAESRVNLENPNPFYSAEETEPLASCGYRYRKFDLSVTEDEEVHMIVRTEVDAFIRGAATGANAADAEDTYITIKALNEFDPRAQGSGNAPDWRTKLDTQRGAVVATEMKNNSSKLARWAVQSILAGAGQMKIGYISRANFRDAARHTILGTQWYKPRDFAAQMNVNLVNGWGIVRTIADLCLKQPEGKYALVKDPNKPVIRLYRVPDNAFDPIEDIDEEQGENLTSD